MLFSGQLAGAKDVVDYVNPYVGNISHLLVPTFPTVQLPNSMLRVYPERADYTSEYCNGLPVIVTNHRERSAFKLLPQLGDELKGVMQYNYDNERLTPYSFSIELADNTIKARYAVDHQSAQYQVDFTKPGQHALVLTTQNGDLHTGAGWISGSQLISGQTKVYVYMETEERPVATGIVENGKVSSETSVEGRNVSAAFRFTDGLQTVHLRYGVSFISEEQAKRNLRREQNDYDLDRVAAAGRKLWNETLSRIQVEGGTEDEKTVLYTSYYRTFERPVCMSEDGRYWSASDNQVHADEGTPYYTDDWIWDTYRAAHPLRVLTDQPLEANILTSFLRMSEQNGTGWIPTFPEVNGDSRRMNSNHTTATFADAMAHGMNINLAEAYQACRRCIEEKSLAPWSGESKAGWIDRFYKNHGYIPALAAGEKENDPNVNKFEKRQPVAVTLGTAYDQWCLSLMADQLAKTTKQKKLARQYAAQAAQYRQASYNFRNLYNAQTAFFHPKDSAGRFIEPFDYAFSGGMGAREYYGENNGWVYRWDVPQHISDLVSLMGGPEKFAANLDQTFAAPLGRSKYEFWAKLPDHTGLIGQFSMANEPSFIIPYLYNYCGMPWKTQKRIRQALKTWFRNDLEGVPGDEDGGGMTSFVVFSSLGFYPVTVGMAMYNIGSPLFTDARLRLTNGKTFEIIAHNASDANKYIQSAKLNGRDLNQPWFLYNDIKDGGVLELQMGPEPNKQWGAQSVPPSGE